ncbi:MAG: DUF2813 domain-containing protein [Chitinophagaceae bacterium]|nr:MAG: DUF2813 domain-containing protein [Chitinophagaceae bacterium]
MKIKSVRIENFRSIKSQDFPFDNYTCLVGANGAGKSNVFCALRIFFRDTKDQKTDLTKLSKEDFHHGNINDPVTIQVTFCDLSDQAKEDLKDYVRQDQLIVTAKAVFDENKGFAEVKQFGKRLGMDAFRVFFEKEKAGGNATDLKLVYNELKTNYPDLPSPGSKENNIAALREYEAKHPEQCVLIESNDEFYGATRGSNRLASHLQWVFVPASKDVTTEAEESRNSALGMLLVRTIRSKVDFSTDLEELRKQSSNRYRELLEGKQEVLGEISTSLTSKLGQWANPSIQAQVRWRLDSEKSVRVEEPTAFIQIGEKGFEGELSRFGHGLQRSYMLALLQELNTVDTTNSPTLLLCIEEPELFQHPPQARHLANILEQLSMQNSQVMICSHSPYFIPKANVEQVRVIRESGTPPESICKYLSYEQLFNELKLHGKDYRKKEGVVARLYPFLSPMINEMFFCRIPVFVEGIEDIAYIKTYLELSGMIEEFRKLGCHLINADKKEHLIEPLAIAKLLGMPAYCVFDADIDAKPDWVENHKKMNRQIIGVQNAVGLNEWPTTICHKRNLWLWPTHADEAIKPEIPSWQHHAQTAALEYGNPGGLGKNALAIARTLELAWNAGERSPSLLQLVTSIVDFARDPSPDKNEAEVGQPATKEAISKSSSA